MAVEFSQFFVIRKRKPFTKKKITKIRIGTAVLANTLAHTRSVGRASLQIRVHTHAHTHTYKYIGERTNKQLIDGDSKVRRNDARGRLESCAFKTHAK